MTQQEKFGIEDLLPLATAMGQMTSLGYGFLVEKKGIFAILFGVQAPMSEFAHFFTADVLARVKDQLLDVSEAERKQLDAAVLAPMQPALLAVASPIEGLFDKCVAFVLKNIEVGKEDVADVQVIIADFKGLFGI